VQEAIAAAMEARALDPAQAAMRRRYLDALRLPSGAKGVELGSGTGHVSREMLEFAGCAEVLGVEPGPAMIARASALFADVPGLSFAQGRAEATGLAAASIDLVVMHTLLCHVAEPAEILAEAARIARPGAALVVFDGDYAASSVSIAEGDPLEAVVKRFIADNVHDMRLMRRAPAMLEAAGFAIEARWTEGYVPEDPAYFFSVVDRAADHLAGEETITAATAEALKAEARSRQSTGRFFGFMSYQGLRAIRR